MTDTAIDPKRVNLLEQDIEEWLFHNPEEIPLKDGSRVSRWIARQFNVPSGIIDLLGVSNCAELVVAEIKNTEITAEAMAQVARYAKDIQEISSIAGEYTYQFEPQKVIVGKGSVSTEVLFEAEALDITLCTFKANLSIDIGGYWHFNDEHNQSIRDQYQQISESEPFDFIRAWIEADKTAGISESNDEETNDEGIIEEAKRIIEEET